ELLLPQPRAGAARLVPLYRPRPHRLRALRQAAGIAVRLHTKSADRRPRSPARPSRSDGEDHAGPARLGRDDRDGVRGPAPGADRADRRLEHGGVSPAEGEPLSVAAVALA